MDGYEIIQELMQENKRLKQDNLELNIKLREAEAILKDILKNDLKESK